MSAVVTRLTSAAGSQRGPEAVREIPFLGPWRTPSWVIPLGVLSIVAGLVSNHYTQNLLGLAGAFVVAAVGYNVVLGYAGQLAFGHSGFMALGAYTYAILSEHGQSFPLALLAGIVVPGLIAMIVGVAALRVSHLYLSLITLAFAQAINVIASVLPITGRTDGIAVDVFGVNAWLFALIAAIVVILVIDRLVCSPFGRAFTMIREDEQAGATMGVARVSIKVMAFVISGVLGGLGGILLGGSIGYVTPQNFDVQVTLFVLTMLIVGGLGSLIGCVAGVALLVYIQYGLQVPPGSLNIMYGLILLVVIIVLPGGLASLPRRIRHVGSMVRLRRSR